MPGIHLAGDPERLCSGWINGIKRCLSPAAEGLLRVAGGEKEAPQRRFADPGCAAAVDYQVTSGSSMSIGNGRSTLTLVRKTPVMFQRFSLLAAHSPPY
jgi:hypothetical protein